MELNRMLYATDLEEPRNRLLESMLDVTKVGLREVVFLHSRGKNIAERYYRDWQTRFWNQGVKVWAHREEGSLVDSISRVASDDSFSLVVAEFGEEGVKVVSRSALRRLVKGLATPLLIVRQKGGQSQEVDRPVFDRVVFATDWSPSAERAATFLLDFNGLIKEMDIVNVIGGKLTVGEMRELKKRLQETRRMFSSQGVDAEFHIYAGRVPEEIMLAAGDYHATMIVMGNSRKAAVRKIFPGRTVYKVAEETVVPTLFIP